MTKLELSNTHQRLLDAAAKMSEGQRLWEEGRAILDAMLNGHSTPRSSSAEAAGGLTSVGSDIYDTDPLWQPPAIAEAFKAAPITVTPRTRERDYTQSERDALMKAYDRLHNSRKAAFRSRFKLSRNWLWQWRTKPTIAATSMEMPSDFLSAKKAAKKSTKKSAKAKKKLSARYQKAANAKIADPVEEAELTADIYKMICSYPWHTKTSLMAETGCDFHRITRITKALIAKNKIRCIAKSGRPGSKQPSRLINYYEKR